LLISIRRTAQYDAYLRGEVAMSMERGGT
jgi:hypothetical protein